MKSENCLFAAQTAIILHSQVFFLAPELPSSRQLIFTPAESEQTPQTAGQGVRALRGVGFACNAVE